MVGAGRFAPSPTSQLHLGNLRTALLAWLFARSSGRAFYVRIEDLDQQRVRAAAGVAEDQLRDLAALGIEWDPPLLRQSDRTEIYEAALAQLDVYECFCTRAEIAAASQAPHAGSRPYPGTCARLNSAERAARRRVRPGALRVRAGGVHWQAQDRFAGDVEGVVDDFVVRRNDKVFAYHLACVVDDGCSGVDQVVRGVDLLDSAPRQAWLATQLGYSAPSYVHVGLAVNAAGQRLAKRDGATAAEFRGDPEVILGLLCDSLGFPRVRDAGELLVLVQEQPELLNNTQLAQPWTITN